MRGAPFIRSLALGLAVAGLAAACHTLPNPSPSPQGGGFLSFDQTLSESGHRQSRAYALFSEGIHSEVAHDFPAAEAAYREALSLDPASEELAIRVAVTLLAQRNLRDALTFAESFIASHPDAQSVHTWLGAAYLDTEEYQRAADIGRQMAEAFPTNAIGWGLWANALRKLDPAADPAPAIDILTRGTHAAVPPTPVRQELANLCIREARRPDISDADRATLIRRAADQLRLADAESPPDRETLATLVELLLLDHAIDEAFVYARRLDSLAAASSASASSAPNIRPSFLNAFLEMPPAEAEAILRRLAGDDPTSPLPYLYLGEIHYANSDLPAAADDYRRAIDIDSSVPFYWCKLAAMQADDDRFDLALDTLQTALQRLPGDPSLLELAGIVAATLQRFPQAAAYFTDADAAFAASSDATPIPLYHITAAETFTATRQPEEAARHLLLAAEENPETHPLERFTRHALMGTGTSQRNAIATLRKLVRLSTRPLPSVHVQLALFSLNDDNPKAALREFRKAIAELKDGEASLSPLDAFFYAVALDRTGHLDDTIRVLTDLTARSPDFPEPHNYLAYTLAVHDRDLPSALAHIQKALAADPDNYAFLDTLAWVRYKLGDYPEAWTAIQSALEKSPTPSAELAEHYNAIAPHIDPALPLLPVPEE